MLRKTIFRTIRSSLGRYVAILAIIALGVGFFAGLRVTEATMLATADGYIKELNLYDFRLISTLGLTDEDVSAFAEFSGVETAVGSFSSDAIFVAEDGSDAVFHTHSLLDGMNGLDVLQGRLPETATECVIDARYVGANNVLGKETISRSISLCFIVRQSSTAPWVSLSAMGSRILPKSETIFHFRAIKPSITSVTPDKTMVPTAHLYSCFLQ